MFCEFSFNEKVRIFSHEYLKCCVYIANVESPKNIFTKMLFTRLGYTSQLLEDLLDSHGAKNNKTWFLYRELSAAIRHLSAAGYSQKHILNRLVFYDLPDSDVFQKDGSITLNFITNSLIQLAPKILEEANRLDIPLPSDTFDATDFPGITTGEMLEYDIDDNGKEHMHQNIVKLANDFLNISGHFEQFGIYEPYDIDKMMSLVPDRINEVEVRRFEMQVHNLQSYFDTYVILHGGFTTDNKKLKLFRSYFSVVFHLLQMMGRLLHFYERHLHEISHKEVYNQVRSQLSALIDPATLLDRTINYGLYYICHFLSTGKTIAHDLLNENMERTSIQVGIPRERGFHCRPSLLVAKIVQHYGGQVELCAGSSRFDASSVLDIQWAGGKIQQENIQAVIFEGDARALRDIEILAGINYAENTMGEGIPLPGELSYLKDLL